MSVIPSSNGGGGVGADDGDYQATGAPPAQPPRPEFTYDLNGVNPTADLSYNSFLRGYGLNKQNAQAQADYTRDSLNASLAAQQPIFDQQLKEGVTNAGEAGAARGAARSSSRIHDQDVVTSDVANRRAAFSAGIADKQAQNAFGLTDQLISLETNRSQRELDARMGLLQQRNQQTAYEQALRDLGL